MAIEPTPTDRPQDLPLQSPGRQTEPAPDVPAEELLDLLGDENTRQILRLVAEEPMGGRAVADATSVSRATAYRHLNRLHEAGLVASRMECDPDGHHRELFYAVLEGVDLSFDLSGFAASVSLDHGTASDRSTRAVVDPVGDD